MLKRILAIICLSCMVIPIFSQSDENDFLPSESVLKKDTSPFALNWVTDSILLSVGVGATIGTFFLPPKSPAGTFEISDKFSINSFDRFFMRPYNRLFDLAGDVTMIISLVLPVVLFAIPEKKDWLTIAVMYTEAILLSHATKEYLKFGINRSRPYLYFPNISSGSLPKESKQRESFPSGHATLAFAGASFTSYVFYSYFPRSLWNIPVSLVSYSLAFTTASLRVASGSHFLTDVFVGALIGTLYGIGVPFLHTFNKKMKNNNIDIAFIPTGLYVKYTY
ncbi:MAG: phosphatase PAP2 family protein [Treponemataceae bacterium]